MFDGHFPFTHFLVPISTHNLGIKLEIPIQMPLLDSVLDVSQNFWTTGIELLPIRIGVERKCLVLSASIQEVTADSQHSRIYVLEHRIVLQDSDLRAMFHQHHLELRIWCARRYFSWQAICAGICAP